MTLKSFRACVSTYLRQDTFPEKGLKPSLRGETGRKDCLELCVWNLAPGSPLDGSRSSYSLAGSPESTGMTLPRVQDQKECPESPLLPRTGISGGKTFLMPPHPEPKATVLILQPPTNPLDEGAVKKKCFLDLSGPYTRDTTPAGVIGPHMTPCKLQLLVGICGRLPVIDKTDSFI